MFKQRRAYGEGKLEASRTQRLQEVVGWTWEPQEVSWGTGFNHLVAYVNLHRHPRVPVAFEVAGFKLGQWVMAQRAAGRRGDLREDRVEGLLSLDGWVWNLKEAQWDEKYVLLRGYAEREGHARVPQSHVEQGEALGVWVDAQRRRYAKGRLEPDRINRLEVVPGWAWDARS